ncbi:MAG: hypothetical protein AAGB34_02275, partial [Planctomycetota bacterium]
ISDDLTRIASNSISTSETLASAESIVESASGAPMTFDQAEAYSLQSLESLRTLAISNNQLLRPSDASAALITTLAVAEGDILNALAEVLSLIPQQRAQIALAEQGIALSSDPEIRIMLLDQTATSVKRFGNLLEPRHIDAIRTIASSAEDDEATSAAALLGALNLPTDQITPFVFTTR